MDHMPKTFLKHLSVIHKVTVPRSQTIDGSHGLLGDLLYVFGSSRRAASSESITEGTRIHDVAKGIADNFILNPLNTGEQFNLLSISQGSVTTAQAVINISRDPSKYGLNEKFRIDNLILGGSPINKKSKLYNR